MAQIGKAWVEVRADLTKFPAELKAKLTAAIKAGMQGVDFSELEDKAGEAGRRAADEAGRSFRDRSRTQTRQAGEEAGRGLLAGITSAFKRGGSGSPKDKGGLFSGLMGGFSDAFEAGFGGAAGKLGQVGQLVGQLSNLGGPVAAIAQLAALAFLGPILLGLAGAVVQLSGALLALPAAGGVAIGILAPLMIAFQGVGEAIGAGLSGDTEKFAEALKGLAPAAQSVVREFVTLKPIFDSIKRTVQQAFFAPLIGEVRRFGVTVLPLLQGGLTKIGGALGHVFRELLRVFSSPAALQTFNSVLQTSLAIVQRMEPALSRLFEGLLAAIGPALPFVERFVFFLLDGLGSIGDWLSKISGNGQLTGWLKDATETGEALWGVIKQFGSYLFTLLSSFGAEGTTFLSGLADELQKVVEWLGTDEGSQFLEDVGVAITAAGTAILWLVSLAPYVMRFYSILISAWREVDDILAAVGGWFADVGAAIWSFLTGAGSAIASFFTETIPGWFDSLVGWFEALPGRVVAAVADFGAMLGDWIAGAFKWLIDTTLFSIGVFIGFFLALPQLVVGALVALPGLLADLFTTAWEWVSRVTQEAWDGIVAFVFALPGRLAEAGAAVVAWGQDLWSRVSNFAINTVTEGFNRVVSFFQQLPGRIAALGPAMFSAAMGLGRKIGEGLSNIGSFASDVGRKIVNSLKSGINYVISGINRGIAEVDSFIPGSLPRLPHFARGAVVDSPTVGLIGEAGREVILPLTDPKRTQQLAEESGLLGMLRGGGEQRPVVNLTAYLDGSGVLIPVIDMRVDSALATQGAELSGART